MTSMAVERRSTAGVVELRAAAGGGSTIGGYAIVYSRYSQNLGGYVEQCAPGLADKTLADGADVLCRFHHDSDMLLGRVSASTLRLASDQTGVVYDDDLPDTGYARDLAALVGRKDVRHSSFAFRTLEDEWGFTEQGFPLRTLLKVQLVDVAPVVTPAYLDTTSALRSLAERRSLDPEVVLTAAAVGGQELAVLLRAKAPTVVDLGASAGKRDDGCECCPVCAEVEECPGCDCVECRQCGGKGKGRSLDSTGGAQGATHAPLALRRRRAALELRRIP